MVGAEGVQMNVRVIVGITSFCVALTGVFLANTFVTQMIGEISRKRPEGALVSYFGFTFLKMLRVFNEYRASYPTGSLHMYASVSFAVAMAALLSVAVCLHIIG